MHLVQAMAFSSFLEKIAGAFEMLGWILGHLAVILTAWLVGVGSLEENQLLFFFKAWRLVCSLETTISSLKECLKAVKALATSSSSSPLQTGMALQGLCRCLCRLKLGYILVSLQLLWSFAW